MKAITHEIRNWGEFFVLDEYEHVKVKRLVIKDGNSTIYTRLRNDRWSFMQRDEDPLVGDAEVLYISNKKLYISSAEITGLDGEDGNLDVNGPAKVKELHVDNSDVSNSLVIKSESNGSFSILVQTETGE